MGPTPGRGPPGFGPVAPRRSAGGSATPFGYARARCEPGPKRHPGRSRPAADAVHPSAGTNSQPAPSLSAPPPIAAPAAAGLRYRGARHGKANAIHADAARPRDRTGPNDTRVVVRSAWPKKLTSEARATSHVSPWFTSSKNRAINPSRTHSPILLSNRKRHSQPPAHSCFAGSPGLPLVTFSPDLER